MATMLQEELIELLVQRQVLGFEFCRELGHKQASDGSILIRAY